jgi:hypothetical protein
MTSAIEKATNSIYNKLNKESLGNYELPIKTLDGIRCDCDFFTTRDGKISFVIEILDTQIINVHGNTANTYKLNCKITEECMSKIFISDMLRDLPKLKFNKLKNRFEIPNEDEDQDLLVFELFKDEANIQLKIETCPCCLEPCNWKLAYTCGHSICPPCYQKLPNTIINGKDNKTCPTCRGDCIKIVDECDCDSDSDSDSDSDADSD